jgi:hypothetical protein
MTSMDKQKDKKEKQKTVPGSICSSLERWGKQSQGEQDGFGNRLAILVSG